mmetsp:Transcript_6025/g.19322  ORF Transcript_6025/g.19322 Transcript_6025/m.19322 type:complete len:886 (+) Transcript_6025:78-2735(+)
MASQANENVTAGAASEEVPALSKPGSGTETMAKSKRHWMLSALVGAALVTALVVAALVSKSIPAQHYDDASVGARAHRFLKASNISSVRNPFGGKVFYKNPANQISYDQSIDTSAGVVKQNLVQMREVPSAYWIDVKAKIRGTGARTLEGILADASSKSTAEMVVFIWYDLPNRDCHAKASNGEICCKYKSDGRCDYAWKGNCEAGLKEYKETYANPFVEVLQKYAGKVPVAVVVEPDSLPNLATNSDDPRCGGQATKQAYGEGIKYAVEQLTSKTPEVAVYLDAAHGGWLGWQDNLVAFMRMLKRIDLPVTKIRGFATNVANYQPLGALCPHQPDSGNRNGYCLNGRHSAEACCEDPCGLAREWSAGNNELNYAQELAVAAKAVLGMDAHMVIDTGRNGKTSMRQDCAHWCNVRGAGAGVASTASTAAPAVADAYFWLKTPGESDGCSQILPNGQKCPRFDAKCASVDSLGSKSGEVAAPEAGMWFDFQVKQLAEYAHFDPPSVKSEGSCPASTNPAPPVVPTMVSPQSSSSSSSTVATGGAGSPSSAGSCSGAYQQCGGQNWAGPTCCQTGCKCVGSGGYYSQCTPSDPSTGVCSAGSLANSAGAASASAGSSRQPTSAGVTPVNAGSSGQSASAVVTVPAVSDPLGQGASEIASSASTATPSQSMLGQFSDAPPGPIPAAGNAPSPSPLPPSPSPMAGSQAQLVPATQSLPLSASQSALTMPLASTSAAPPMLPAAGPASSPALVPSVASAQPAAASQCAVPYGQCGGSGWNGPTCCDVYCTCQVVDASTSQCMPAGTGASQPSTVGIVLKDEIGSRVHLANGSAASTLPRWAAAPMALVLVAFAAGLARRHVLSIRNTYAAVGPHRADPAMPVADADMDIA